VANELEKAQGQYEAGEYKRAVDTLWEVTFVGGQADLDARRMIELATQLKGETKGSAQRDCEEHVARAQRYLEIAGGPEKQAGKRSSAVNRRDEWVRSAREARAAGLTWLELRSREDMVVAEMQVALALNGAEGVVQPGAIDAVEAEGWRLEHFATMFRPTKVQTSVLRGAEYFMGGEVVEGEESYLYLFRRADETLD
jgi:hypothetical protein